MRAMALLALLAGCYKPSHPQSCHVTCAADTNDCPDGLSCESGVCRAAGDTCDPDDAGNAVDDGSSGMDMGVTPACGPFPLNQGMGLLPSASSYTSDGTIAIFEQGIGNFLQVPFDTGQQGSSLGFDSFSVTQPRLSAGGTDMYMHDTTNMNMARATRMGASTWSMQGSVTVSGIATDANFVPGNATATNPRHMIVEQGSQLLKEGTEMGGIGGPWDFAKNVSFSRTFTFLHSPILSPDGKQIVFIGQEGGGQRQVYFGTRSNIMVSIFQVAPLYDYPGGTEEQMAIVNGACDVLFVEISNQIRRIH
jgi:WD40 repeat protein